MTDKIKSAVGEALRASSGYDGIEGATIAAVGELIGNLLVQNWSQIKACRDRSDEATVSISFGAEVDASGTTPVVKAKIGYSTKYTDALEAVVDDPDQEKLPLDGDGAPLSPSLAKAAKKLQRVLRESGGTMTIGGES